MSKKEKKTESVQVEKDVKKKSTKKAIKSIPAMPFEDVLYLSKGIWECASGKRVRKITLFDHLGKSPDSGPSRTLITSSSKYGLTTGGYQADYLELTIEGAKASNPDGDDREIAEARFKLAIQENIYFNHLYDSYKNMKVPTNKVLEDCIIEFGIEEHEAKQCVETFIVNAKFLGLIKTLSGAQRLITIEHLLEEIKANPSLSTFSSNGSNSPLGEDCSNGFSASDVSYDNICFYITPIGEEGSEQRKHSDMLLECLVTPVLEEYGLKAIRADYIDKPGIITNQILDYITKSRMVIADLSFHNPNVFYELAVRHMKGLPAIHLSRTNDKIPFDIGNFRTITLDMTDLYTFVPQIETYKSQISSQLRNLLEANGDAENPISSYLSKGE